MDFKTFFFKKVLLSFFIAVTCICATMATLGLLFFPNTRFGYEALLSPLLYGMATLLPGLVNYSKHELSVKEAAMRKLIQLVLIEIIVLSIVYSSGTLTGTLLTTTLVLSIFLIYLTVHLVLWLNDKKTAKTINEALLNLQQNNIYKS